MPYFEPSSFVKHIYLYTRKVPVERHEHPRVPGLFRADWGIFDIALLFLVALTVEAAGLGYLYFYGQENPDQGVELSAVIGLFLGDIVAAILLHWHNGVLCERRNRAFVNGPVVYQEFGWRVVISGILHYLGIAMIIAMCAIKVGTFMNIAENEDFGGGYRAMAILGYLSVGATHIWSTGYGVARMLLGILEGWLERKAFKFDEVRYNVHRAQGGPEAPPAIRHAGYQWWKLVAPNQAAPVEEAEGVNFDVRWGKDGKDAITVRSEGILWDENIDFSVRAQRGNVAAEAEVARAMKKLQLNQLDGNPPGPEVVP